MNRDKKLGLALGVLLLGIVAAFFFRNEPAGGPEPPLLENPKPVNDRIAERPAVPYLNDVDSERPKPRTTRPRTIARETARDAGWSVQPSDDWIRKPSPAATDSFASEPSNIELARNDAPSRGSLPPPQPIPVPVDPPARTEAAKTPDHNREWMATDTAPKAAASDVVMHEVKSGETLSGLAVKYLGSSTRYDEIMKANRDQIRTPKDLRAGMRIRIPKRVASKPAAERAADARSKEPGAPDPKRTADEKRSKPVTPTRNVSSSGVEDLDEPWDVEPAPPTQPARITRPTERIEREFVDEEPAAPIEVPSGRTFRPARRNPFLPGTEGTGSKAVSEPAGSKALGQRVPDNLPSAKTSEIPEPSIDSPLRGDVRPTESTGSRTPLSQRPPADVPEVVSPTRPSTPTTTERIPRVPVDRLAPGRYVVQRGDTLERIAKRLLGDPNASKRILDANRDILQDAEELREGMSLRIPL